MNRSVDVQGILQRAGADPEAPEGSQGWALAQVATAVADLIAAHASLLRMTDSGITSLGVIRWARKALARVGGDA